MLSSVESQIKAPKDKSSFDPDLNPYVALVRAAHPCIQIGVPESWNFLEGFRVILDLGCGNGHFLQTYLKNRDLTFGLGVERRYKRVYKSAEKLGGLKGLIIKCEIEDFLEKAPRELCDEIWLQFPDPWPKKRHEKNRMIHPQFLVQIHRLLRIGGRFCFRSDTKPYFEELQLQNASQKLFGKFVAHDGDRFEHEPQTLYQRKFIQSERSLYSLEFQKNVK